MARRTFRGLPGLLADSLPDRFGNALIDAWLASQGRTAETFDAVERVCYTGTRGMGALEFVPALGPRLRKATTLAVDALVQLASEVLTHRADVQGGVHAEGKAKALRDFLSVGTSAGGAKLYMQSLGALAHFDFNQAGAYSYEQASGRSRRRSI